MKFLFAFLLSLIVVTAKAQSLTIDQLMLLAGKSQEGVDSYLEAKGWEQAPSSDGADFTWAYKREIDEFSSLYTGDKPLSESKIKYKASSWLNMVHIEGAPAVVYDILSSAKYQAMKQRVVILGFKRISFKQDEEKSVSCYTHGVYKIYIVTKFSGDRLLEANSYSVAVIKNI